MTLRTVDDGFWDWEDIQDFTPTTKLLYLYSWTNKSSNLAACYQITKRTMMFQTGLSSAQIDRSLADLKGKLAFEDSYIWVRNFIRRQPGCANPSFLQRVNKILGSLPDRIALEVWLYNESHILGWSEYVNKPPGTNRWVPTGDPPSNTVTVPNTNSNTSDKEGECEGEDVFAEIDEWIENFKDGAGELTRSIIAIPKFPRDGLTVAKFLTEKIEEYSFTVVSDSVEAYVDNKLDGDPLTAKPLGQLGQYIKNTAKREGMKSKKVNAEHRRIRESL